MFMPPRPKITKEEILDCALTFVAKNGLGKLNARAIAKELNSSTQPIFSYFLNMDDLKTAIRKKILSSFMEKVSSKKRMIDFEKELLKFASQYSHYFDELFLGIEETEETKNELNHMRDSLVPSISKEFLISKEKANIVYLNNWIYSFGLGALIAKGMLSLKESSLETLLKINLEVTIAAVKKQ